MGSKELKPCPFCGGDHITISNEREAYDGGDRWWCYECDVVCRCGASLHVYHGETRHNRWDTAETELDFAIEAWNRRHG